MSDRDFPKKIKTVLKKPPICMPDQVLCKQATVERLQAQQARWLLQREEALHREARERPDVEHELPAGRTAGDRRGRAEEADGCCQRAVTASEQARQLISDAVREELKIMQDASAAASAQGRQKGIVSRTLQAPVQSKNTCAAGSDGFKDADEDFAELDEMQDFLTAMEFQMKEIDDL